MFFYLKIYLVALATFLAVDFVWLAMIARNFYREQLGFLLADKPNWWAAATFYLLFVAGVVVFAILPALLQASLKKAVILGGFFGLVTYATYDLTNHATVENWPWMVTAIDLAWGTFLTATVSCSGYLAGRRFKTAAES